MATDIDEIRVRAELEDELSRPARDAREEIEQLGKTSERAGRGARKLEGRVRRLGSRLQRMARGGLSIARRGMRGFERLLRRVPFQWFQTGLSTIQRGLRNVGGMARRMGTAVRRGVSRATRPLRNLRAGFMDASAAASASTGVMGSIGGAVRTGVRTASRAVTGLTGVFTGMASTAARSFRGVRTALQTNLLAPAAAARSQLAGMVGGIAAMGRRVGGLAAAIGVGMIGFQAVSGAASQQRARATLSAMYGAGDFEPGEADRTLAQINERFGASPLGMKTFVGGAESLAYLGLGAEQTTDILATMENFIISTGGSAQDLTMVTDALAEAFNRGRASLNELNRLSQAGVPIMDMLSEKLDMPIPAVMEAASAGDIGLDVIIDALENVEGKWGPALQEGAEAAKNSFSFAWQGIKNSIVNGISEQLVPMLDDLSPKLINLRDNITAWFEDLPERLEAVVEWFGRLGDMLAPLKPFVPFLKAFAAAFGALLIGKMVLSGIAWGIKLVWSAIVGFSPLLILAAIAAALYLLWTRSETFRDVVTAAWEWIKVAAKAVADWFVNTALPVLSDVWDGIATGAVWLWRNALKPAWDGIWAAVSAVVDWAINTAWPFLQTVWEGIASGAQWLWTNVLSPVWTAIQFAFNVLVTALKAYWDNVLHPVFTAVAEIAKWLWVSVLRRVFQFIVGAFKLLAGAFVLYWTYVLKPVFTAIWEVAKWLWENILKPIFENIADQWDDMTSLMKRVWESFLQPIFEQFGEDIGRLWEVFQTAVDAISRAWAGLKEAAVGPIEFVVDVINRGLIDPFNTVARVFGVDVIPNIVFNAPPAARTAATSSRTGGVQRFGTGGYVSGPGGPRDDQIPARLSDGEYVVNAASTSRWLPLLEALNARGYQGGGLVSSVASAASSAGSWIADKASDVFDNTIGLLTDPIGTLTKIIDRMLSGLSGNRFAQLAASVPRDLIEGIGTWLRERLGSTEGIGAGGPGGAMGWQTMINVLRAQFPGLALHSGFRPGAITATGNPSYHGKGRAVDVPPRMDVFEFIRSTFGARTKELIFSPAGARQIHNGSPHVYTGVTKAMHYDHVHWAYDQGGILPPGVHTVANLTGRDEYVLNEDQMRRRPAAQPVGTVIHLYGPLIGEINPQTPMDVTSAVRQALDDIEEDAHDRGLPEGTR